MRDNTEFLPSMSAIKIYSQVHLRDPPTPRLRTDSVIRFLEPSLSWPFRS